MSDSHPELRPEGYEARGETAALMARLGDVGLLALAGEPAGLRSCGEVRDAGSLRAFLVRYREEVLLPREIPWILRAWRCAESFQPRELIELDRELGREVWIQELRVASRQVGRSQLRSLKPLRDLRLLQRYREAVETGRAHGWHLIVYGLVLSTYSIPLRPGLVSYGLQTLHGFLEAAGRQVGCTAEEALELREGLGDGVPAGVHRLLGADPVYI